MQSNSQEDFLNCHFCNCNLEALSAEDSCPSCGLHVSQTLRQLDEDKLVDSDKLHEFVPVIAEIWECVEKKNQALRDIKDIEQDIAEKIITAAIQAGQRPYIIKSVIRELYWKSHDIKVKWIQEAFNLKQYQVIEEAGAGEIVISCDSCGDKVVAAKKSRSSTYQSLCPRCETEQDFLKQKESIEFARLRELEQQRSCELKTMSYKEYLQSEEWQSRRKRHLRSAGFKCQVCNAGNTRLDVHHRTYERRGHEYFKDLIVLCAACHELFHAKGRLVIQ